MNNKTSYSFIKDPFLPIDKTLFNVVFGFVLLFLCEVVGIFGIVANTINILVFKKQGYKDGVNVTLTALAVSDIGVLVTQMMYIQIMNPWTDESNFIMSKSNMAFLLLYINEYFIRAGGFITSFAAFERCLCVVLPLKVKSVVNAKVAVIVNVIIFISLTAYLALPYCLLYVDWRMTSSTNTTVLHVYFRDNRDSIMRVYYLVAGICIPYLTILLLMVFTTVLIVKIRSSVTWRSKTTNNGATVNHKERKAVTMLAAVSVIYVVSIVPHSSLNTAVGIVDELKSEGSLNVLTKLCYFFSCLFEAVNCSVTICIYYKMSSKYKQTIQSFMSY